MIRPSPFRIGFEVQKGGRDVADQVALSGHHPGCGEAVPVGTAREHEFGGQPVGRGKMGIEDDRGEGALPVQRLGISGYVTPNAAIRPPLDLQGLTVEGDADARGAQPSASSFSMWSRRWVSRAWESSPAA